MSIAEAGRIGAEIKALVQSGVSPRKEQERKLEEARRAEKNTFEAVGRMFFAEKKKMGRGAMMGQLPEISAGWSGMSIRL